MKMKTYSYIKFLLFFVRCFSNEFAYKYSRVWLWQMVGNHLQNMDEDASMHVLGES